MPIEETSGSMTSRAIQKVPENPKELAIFLQKVLQEHYRDIATLFAQCTDNDRVEKLRRDNEQL